MTSSKVTSSGFGLLVCQRRVLAKVSRRFGNSDFCDLPEMRLRVKARPELVPPSSLVPGFDPCRLSGYQPSEAHFLQTRASPIALEDFNWG